MAVATDTVTKSTNYSSAALRDQVYCDARDLKSPVDLYGTPIGGGEYEPLPASSGGGYGGP